MPFLFLEWIGMNAMLVFVMAAQGIFPAFVNGWYYENPDHSLVSYIPLFKLKIRVFREIMYAIKLAYASICRSTGSSSIFLLKCGIQRDWGPFCMLYLRRFCFGELLQESCINWKSTGNFEDVSSSLLATLLDDTCNSLLMFLFFILIIILKFMWKMYVANLSELVEWMLMPS